MDQRRNGRGSGHRIGQPDIERQLRALARAANEQQQARQPAPTDRRDHARDAVVEPRAAERQHFAHEMRDFRARREIVHRTGVFGDRRAHRREIPAAQLGRQDDHAENRANVADAVVN